MQIFDVNETNCTRAGQHVLSLSYLNKREMDEHTFIFQHNHCLCQCTDAIFTVRQMQEKFRAKGKKLYFGLVDFEKFW